MYVFDALYCSVMRVCVRRSPMQALLLSCVFLNTKLWKSAPLIVNDSVIFSTFVY